MLKVMKLDNYDEWLQAEREFRLCPSLRVTEVLPGRLTGALSARDWGALLEQVRSVLATEEESAGFPNIGHGQEIDQSLQRSADQRTATAHPAGDRVLHNGVEQGRTQIRKEAPFMPQLNPYSRPQRPERRGERTLRQPAIEG